MLVSGCITRKIVVPNECGWYEPIYPHLTKKEIKYLNNIVVKYIKYNDKEFDNCSLIK